MDRLSLVISVFLVSLLYFHDVSVSMNVEANAIVAVNFNINNL